MVHILQSLTTTQLECTAYGAYAVLFGFAVWVLPRKFNVLAVKMFFFPAIIALFFSATLNVAFGLMAEMKFVLVPDRPFEMIIPRALHTYDTVSDSIDVSTTKHIGGYDLVFELFAVTAIIRAFAVPKKPICSRAQIELFTMTFEFMNAFANILMSLMIATLGVIVMVSTAPLHKYDKRDVQLKTPLPKGLGPTLIAARVGLGSAYDHQTWRTTQSSDVVLSTDIESHHPNPESTSEPQYALRRTAVVSSKSASEDLNSALAK
ncbi:hypothetical protein D9757_008641 [Collybiopsis confluens]|uniref:Uncharacterized protein n=1 Tax=Collybiopsis confluens TaxID=2823264 RepID=A0A8H5H485_9AGAR|nr:hypothetical protein D9757_008641 [Collybiopsis confluens]